MIESLSPTSVRCAACMTGGYSLYPSSDTDSLRAVNSSVIVNSF
jgi:hypothetical protein